MVWQREGNAMNNVIVFQLYRALLMVFTSTRLLPSVHMPVPCTMTVIIYYIHVFGDIRLIIPFNSNISVHGLKIMLMFTV